ncbi:UNVERIFIED_CONTAM: hypothetical protein GTU68_049824, partial [Idotea baltica]|nr:hypothetical protein [Idotea baltica]
MKKINIYKLGGKVISSKEKLEKFLQLFSSDSNQKILIHGGGNIANKVLKSMKIEPNQIKGRRVTDSQTLDVVTMVYAGLVNKQIVSKLQSMGCNALGLSGADGNIIVAKKREVKDIDYGFVGDIESVNIETLSMFLRNGQVPVVCSITHDAAGQLLNTNADTIATTIAKEMAAEWKVSIYYYFDFNGVLSD